LRRLLVLLALAAILPVAPCLPAQGEPEGGGHGQDAAQDAEFTHPADHWTGWKWANFVILVGGLGYLIWKKGAGFFRARTDELQQAIAEAAKLREEANRSVAEAEERLRNLEAAIEDLRRRAHDAMAGESERVRLETEQALGKIQSHAEQDIASAALACRLELKAYSAELALALAEQKIRGRLTPEMDRALVSTFVDDMERKSISGSSGREPS
jgi:F-type H+-transporting ATPase subunit b